MKCDSSNLLRARPLLGTFVEITAAGAALSALERAVEVAFDTTKHVHGMMSVHDRASDVSRLNRAGSGETIVVHDWTYQVLEASLGLYCRSHGCFDIAVAPALQELGILPATQDNATHRSLLGKRAFAL